MIKRQPFLVGFFVCVGDGGQLVPAISHSTSGAQQLAPLLGGGDAELRDGKSGLLKDEDDL